MKAVVKYGEAPGQVGLRQIPEPECGETDVKIKICACAVCATDLHIREGAYPWKTGLPLGHEYSGVIVEVGDKVKDFQVGDRVAACMEGGFSQYVVRNETDWVFHLPDEISFEEGALLEPLSAAVNSVFNRSRILPMDYILISGPGVIGLCALQAAKLLGAQVLVTGTTEDTERLKLARALGADRAVDVLQENPEDVVKEFTGGRGLDTVLECSGAQAALDLGLRLLRYDGQLTQVGIFGKKASVDLGMLVYENRRIVGSIAYDRATWMRAIELVRKGRVNLKPLISERMPLEQWEKGFEKTKNRKGYRIVLVP